MRSFLFRVTCTILLLSTVAVTGVLPSDPSPTATAHHHGETVRSLGTPNTPRIGLIGDSTLAAVRWRNIYGDLGTYNYLFNAESCRRTIATSCRGREGYPPANALQTLRIHEGQWGRVLVMMTGYNDPGTRFGDGVDAVVREARRQGIHKVVWLTMRTADVTYESPDYRSDSYTFRDNNRILLQKAVQHRGYLQVADWATHSANRSDWVGNDGIHLTDAGARGVTTYIRDQVRQVLAGRTITPAPNASAVRSWSPLRQGDRGSRVTTLQRALMNAGIALHGGADGHFGSYTRQAVVRYQRRAGINQTGVVYQPMAVRLGIFTPPPPRIAKPDCTVSRALRPDDRLTDVMCLKRHLVSEGFTMSLANNHYGPNVASAVEYYKAVRGFRVDGTAGQPMLRELGAWSNRPARPDCRIMRRLDPGDRLTDVACLKRHLASRGYQQFINASFGNVPVLAMRNLKPQLGLGRDAIAGRTFLQRIGAWQQRPSQPACRISQRLDPGDTHPDVACLKRHLMSRGYHQFVNQAFGEVPRLAVRHLKGELGLRRNAIAGRAFLERIGAWEDPATMAHDAPTNDDPTSSTETPATPSGDPATPSGDPATPSGDPATPSGDPDTPAGDPAASDDDPGRDADDGSPPPTASAPPTSDDRRTPPDSAGSSTDVSVPDETEPTPDSHGTVPHGRDDSDAPGGDDTSTAPTAARSGSVPTTSAAAAP